MTIEELYSEYLKTRCVTTDSRKISEGCIFFGLKGDTFDGNRFAAQALEKGASLCVVDNPECKAGDRCIVVEDSLQTLQELARYHRSQLTIPVVGITGTNGKTTTKELVNPFKKIPRPLHAGQLQQPPRRAADAALDARRHGNARRRDGCQPSGRD